MNIGYYLGLLSLFLFGIGFFAYDLFVPKIKQLKSNRLLFQSKVYLDSSIDNAGGLLEGGVNKARIAFLLNPENSETEDNYLKLLFRTDPVKALAQWSSSVLPQDDLIKKKALLQKCLNSLKQTELDNDQRKVVASIAIRLSVDLEKNKVWMSDPENALVVCNILAEIGHPQKALDRVMTILNKRADFADALFLATKLIVHLSEKDKALEISRKLASLSARRNEIGVKAVRHMTLLNLIQPLSQGALEQCIHILKTNAYSKPIDFLRIYALLLNKAKTEANKNKIVTLCSELFNLNDKDEILIFSNWLARLGLFEHLIYFLPASKAKIDEELFKLRMAALAKLGDLEKISQELNNSPIIPLIWRLVVETRSLSLAGKYEDARKSIDTLLPLIDSDPRKVRSVCHYLESVEDLTSLSHLLEKLIEKPIHQKFALEKLIEYRSASASLNDLISWLSKLKAMRKQTPEIENAFLYFRLLDPQLYPSSILLTELIEQAEEQNKVYSNLYTQITLALAYIRNQDPTQALVSLGQPKEWRKWSKERTAWSFLASVIYSLNHDTEKADLLAKGINLHGMDEAEKNSLMQIFPEQYKALE